MSGNGILKSPIFQRKRSSVGLSVRFVGVDDLQAMDIIGTIKRFLEGQDRVGYVNILQRFAAGEVQDDVLFVWLTELREHISLIGKECEGLIVTLLRQNWPRKDDKLVNAYETFIVNLLSAHTYYLRLVLRSIVDHFTPRVAEPVEGYDRVVVSSEIGDDDLAAFNNVHRVIRAIVTIVPLAPVTLIPLLAECFPYMRRGCLIQVYYVHHLLRIVQYLPLFRKNILEVIVDRMTKLDVYSPKEEIRDAEIQLEEQQDLIGEMEICDSPEVVTAENEVYADKTDDDVIHKDKMAHALADVLDVLMDVMFKFLKHVCYKDDGKLEWEATKKLYRELLSIFDNLILPTHASCHVQFVLFYICSFHPSIAAGFFDYLWKKVIDPNTPSIHRQASVSYIGSFLSRAVFVPISMVVNGFEVICNFIHRYIDSQDGSERSYPDVALHGPFFSTCQAVFYVFAFRHKEILELSDGMSFLKGLNLTRIVSCCLNPLKFCLPVIVTNFATVARNYQLVYCNTIIERNNRLTLPTVSSHKQVTDFLNRSLDSFFPFDPYVLVRSLNHIRPIYREYQGLMDDEEKSDEDDEFLEEKTSFTMGMLVNDDPSTSNLTELLVYGTSPGFRQSSKLSSQSGSF